MAEKVVRYTVWRVDSDSPYGRKVEVGSWKEVTDIATEELRKRHGLEALIAFEIRPHGWLGPPATNGRISPEHLAGGRLHAWVSGGKGWHVEHGFEVFAHEAYMIDNVDTGGLI